MVKRLIVHLGDCKTGSTSIQSILAHRSWQSSTHTLSYPTQFNHGGLAKSLFTKSLNKFKDQRCKDISRKFRESDADIGVISSEAFEFCDPQLLNDAINEYFPEFKDSVSLISYIRPHCSRILASFSEQVKKGGFNGSLSEFLHDFVDEKERTNYFSRCQLWRQIFGSRYRIKPMIPEMLNQKDVVMDFLYECFGDNNFKITAPTRLNESVTVEDLSILRYMHLKLLTLKGQRLIGQQKLGTHLSIILSQIPGESRTKLAFHKTLLDQVVERHKADAEYMDSEFFPEVNNPMQKSLEQASTKFIDQEQSLDASHYYSGETLRMVDCWLEFSRRLLVADPYHFDMMARIPGKRNTNSKL